MHLDEVKAALGRVAHDLLDLIGCLTVGDLRPHGVQRRPHEGGRPAAPAFGKALAVPCARACSHAEHGGYARVQIEGTIVEGHAETEASLFVPPRTYRMYPLEWIEDGDRAALICRVRLETTLGVPYNNVYFFYFRVKDGKLIHIIENIDESLGYTVPFDTHLEPDS